MNQTCFNCGESVTANFCGHCGQKKYARIDKQYIWQELQYTILHANNGLFYSIKKILRNPGKTAREFIDGKRVYHYKPLLLIFVLAGISTFISFKILHVQEIIIKNTNASAEAEAVGFINKLNTYLANYSTILTLLLVPFFAVATKLAFKKWGHNYYEHVIINAYILSVYTLLTIVLIYLPVIALQSSPDVYYTLSQGSVLLVPIILVWVFKHFYFDKPLLSVITRVFAALGLTILGIILVIIPVIITLVILIAQIGLDNFN